MVRPLTGRELNQQHKAMVEAGVSPEARLAWLRREVDLWTEPASQGEADGPVTD